jgi:uncharacterized protein
VALVIDTGVLYAMLDERDPDHEECAELLEHAEEQLVIPSLVLVELDYWVRKFASAEAWLSFCEDVAAGIYVLYPADAALLLAAAHLEAKYADLPLSLVDAAVVCTCEAIGERKVATLDHRHFGVVKTSDGRTLEILPA